jgi:hypothetical protein
MADVLHVKPVSEELWVRRQRVWPRINVIALPDKNTFPFVAPCEGFIERNDTEEPREFVFRHKLEPYYSVFSGSGLATNFGIGVEVQPGVLLGAVDGVLSWRMAAVGSKKDWIDPEEWLKGNFKVWPELSSEKLGPSESASSMGLGDLVLYGGGLYLLLQALKK